MFTMFTTEAQLMDASNRNVFDPEERCPDTESYAYTIAGFIEDCPDQNLLALAITDWLYNGMEYGNEGRTIKQMVDDYIDSNY